MRSSYLILAYHSPRHDIVCIRSRLELTDHGCHHIRLNFAANPTWPSTNGIQPWYVDALQRNDHLDVPRSLSLPLEPHNPQRHVINCAAWFGKEQNTDAKSELQKQMWHCLPGTLYSNTHSLFTRLASCLHPTHARACSSAQSRPSPQLARTFWAHNLHFFVTQLALSLQSTRTFSSFELHFLVTLFVTLFVTFSNQHTHPHLSHLVGQHVLPSMHLAPLWPHESVNRKMLRRHPGHCSAFLRSLSFRQGPIPRALWRQLLQRGQGYCPLD
jgi:hypothetical protein